jgi:hypothetical protein
MGLGNITKVHDLWYYIPLSAMSNIICRKTGILDIEFNIN